MDIIKALEHELYINGESNKKNIFSLVELIEKNISPSICYELLSCRLAITKKIDQTTEKLNIAGCIKSPAYKQSLTHEVPDWPKEYHLLEKIIHRDFLNIAQFWCEFEIYKIKSKYPENEDNKHKKLPLLEEAYHSKIVENIQLSQKLYYTLHHTQPMSLSDAILLMNLSTFIADKGWYEMLESLTISSTGRHFILLTKTNESISTIVGSARIQLWNERHAWLSFSPFFTNEGWQPCIHDSIINSPLLTKVFKTSCIPKLDSIHSFEKYFDDKILKKNHICEVIRLSISGTVQECIFYLFLTQKHLIRELDERGFYMAYVIIEQPWLMNFYQELELNGYLSSSYKNLNDTGRNTYKGFWIIPNLKSELNNTSFKDYKNIVIKNKKRSGNYRND
ncbi:acyl-homoserine-lactone synthase [Vibrio aestuarianus]|uniref:acyl-homoserine-lactone synthase n=1 Tax=Vibrio aestuarianus TaxID=28171 RepID=UPI0021C2AD65|nr:acyl-homoserine-lactone synthase [Vibrio aestuarianus]MDE1208576.1 acyl-homoserine-lactone synthase [Vibrio aestuarianus]MDE1317361.1 acyl-homoserine-lactone synthase [Vibrio aestuarianus]CAH8205959.1 N-(3-hydroxybutanoyl)-L- homoserine lactone synthase LuxM [Vibrio aestuarianus]